MTRMPVKRDWYGQVKVGDTMVGAHRVSYEAYHGAVPDGLHVLHKCDVKCCVNPEHLYAGTHKDNMQDMFRRGYRNTARGSRHGCYKHGRDVNRPRYGAVSSSDEKAEGAQPVRAQITSP